MLNRLQQTRPNNEFCAYRMGATVNSRTFLFLVLIGCISPHGFTGPPGEGEVRSKEARSRTHVPWMNPDNNQQAAELRQARTFFNLKRLQSNDPKMRQHYTTMGKQMLFYVRRKQLESELKEIDRLRSTQKLNENEASILDDRKREASARLKILKIDKAAWEKRQVEKIKQESPELLRRPPTPHELQQQLERRSRKREQNRSST